MLQPVWVFAVAAVLRAARGLYVGGIPWLRPKRAERGCRVESPRSHFHVVGLQDNAAPIRPVLLQRKDQALERSPWIQAVLMHAVAGAKFGFSHRCLTPLIMLVFLSLSIWHPSQHHGHPSVLC